METSSINQGTRYKRQQKSIDREKEF